MPFGLGNEVEGGQLMLAQKSESTYFPLRRSTYSPQAIGSDLDKMVAQSMNDSAIR